LREKIRLANEGRLHQLSSAVARAIGRACERGSRWPRGDETQHRPAHRIRHHYEVERELADRLRLADRNERALLYPLLYDELFEGVLDHPQLVLKEQPSRRARYVQRRLRALRRFLNPDAVYLEIGVGDAALASAVAPYVSKVYGIDVSKQILDKVDVAPNVELVLSDGVGLQLPDQSATVAFSDQVIEHLHPDDLHEHLESVHQALVPGGYYLFLTPNRLSGPHDVSRAFDETSTGLHMREYTNGDLQTLLLNAGFSSARRGFVSSRWVYLEYPLRLVTLLEVVVARLGGSGRWLARTRPVALALGCRVIAQR
jgi:SAM-dependent methyltransferase